MNKSTRLVLAAAFVSLALGACSKKVKEAPPSDTPADTGASTSGIPTDGKYGPSDLDTDACLRQRVVYFDFDQDTLKADFQSAIACHAKYLRDRPEARMTLEGHADERGTREYNVALGERRGNAVSSAVQGSGGSASQINVTSYGEEKPTCLDSSDDCWAKNRRVEIVYTAK